MFFPNLKKIIAKKPKILNLLQLGRGWAPFPFFYLVHLTLACNAHCKFCYQKEGIWNNFPKDFFKISDFEKILKQAKTFIFKRPLIYFFGGEPLLHPQFGSFLSLTQKYHYPCALTTNGILLVKYSDQIAHASNLSQITVSLQGTSEVHEQIIGQDGVFENIISSLHRIKQIDPKKIVNIVCVLGQENMSHLLPLANFLNRSFVKKEIDTLVFRYPVQKEICRIIDTAALQLQIKQLKKIRSNFDILFSAEDWFWVDQATKSFFKKSNCNLPWLGLGIMPNLDVLAGGSILTCAQILGNLRQESFKEIWNGKKICNLRKQILKYGLPLTCQGCCHSQIDYPSNYKT
jgi:MoaA/NifB/PqqE/SkfB family radical SAM enzyme